MGYITGQTGLGRKTNMDPSTCDEESFFVSTKNRESLLVKEKKI